MKLKNVLTYWYVWTFPGIALGISGYLLIDSVLQRGPSIKIFLDESSGIEPEKTSVRFRGVSIGVVKKVSISGNMKEVEVLVDLRSEAKRFAVEGAKFWVVMPKVNIQGVSGLETLFEGNYISALPGEPDSAPENEFRARKLSDSTESIEGTTVYFLEAKDVESINEGDFVTFRGLKIGTVAGVSLSKTAQQVQIQLRVENKYRRLIRNNTVFWKKLAVNAKMGLFGSEIKVGSLDSVLHGGIEIFTPDTPGEIAKPQARFSLSSDPPENSKKWNPNLER